MGIEYMVEEHRFSSNASFQDWLNSLGRQGWELASLDWLPGDGQANWVRCVFRRQRAGVGPGETKAGASGEFEFYQDGAVFPSESSG